MSAARDPAIRVVLMPKDTNERGTIFGGVILSHIDQAGAVAAGRHTPHRMVTVAMKEVVFHEPVYVGDIVSFYTDVTKTGRTSITIDVEVTAQRRKDPAKTVKVTHAQVVYVAVDEAGRPVPLSITP
jgi:acyl-CoA thioesterase YciA